MVSAEAAEEQIARADRLPVMIVRALILGAVCTVAITIAAALSEPASTPEGSREIRAWLAPVPSGWPAQPWPTARYESQWGRETWEARGDPPITPTGRARDFAAQWTLRCGWPLAAFECTRSRLRALWDQGETFVPPWHGPSLTRSEGIVIAAASLGAAEGQFLIPVTPLWSGLLIDCALWALPFLAISLVSRRWKQRRRLRRSQSTH